MIGADNAHLVMSAALDVLLIQIGLDGSQVVIKARRSYATPLSGCRDCGDEPIQGPSGGVPSAAHQECLEANAFHTAQSPAMNGRDMGSAGDVPWGFSQREDGIGGNRSSLR